MGSLRSTLRLLLLLLLAFVWGSGAGALAQSSALLSQRITVGLNLFPNILSIAQGGQLTAPREEGYRLRILYQHDRKGAELLAERLRQLSRKINRSGVEVEVVAMIRLFDSPPGSGLFLSERLDEDLLLRLVERANHSGELLFSPFEGDVERGVMVGLDIRSKIVPYLNLRSLRTAGLELNPKLVRMSRTVE